MSSFIKVEIQYHFKLAAFLKIGAGFGKNNFVDNAMRSRQHASKKEIYDIPGTSVKGRIRANFEQIAHLLPVDAANIFGKERIAGWAHFSNLTPQQPMKIGVSTSTAIDRFRKAAKQQSLRVEEFAQVAYKDQLTGTIEGYVSNNVDGERQLYSLLLALLRTNYFGGDKSVGYGKGTIELESVTLNGEALSIENIAQVILEKLA